MESLRSRVIAAERSVLPSAPHRSGSDARRVSTGLQIGAAVVIGALVVTNVLTWRALTAERAARVALERRAQVAQKATQSAPLAVDWVRLQQLRAATAGAVRIPGPPSAVMDPERKSATTVSSTLNARFAKKLADPAAQDAVRDQQKGMALELYGELLKRWHLTGATAGAVLDALADHEVRQLASALAPGSSGSYSTPNTNAADNDLVRAALNAKQLEELRTYDDSLVDRQTIAPLHKELELAQTPLSKDTTEQLISIMHDERLATPQPTAAPAGAQPGTYQQAMDQWQTDLDQRIRDRAEFILSSDALAKLVSFQNAQRAAASVFAAAMTDYAPVPPTPAGPSPAPN